MQYAITDRHMFPGDEHDRQQALLHQAIRLSRASPPVHYLQLREKDLPPAALTRLTQRLLSTLQIASTPTASRISSAPPLTPSPTTLTPPVILTTREARREESPSFASSPERSDATHHDPPQTAPTASYPSPPKLLLNGPLATALATGADGLHLPSGATAHHLDRIHNAFAHAHRPTPTVSTSCHTLAEVAAANAAGFDLLLFGPIFEKRVHGARISPGLGLTQLHQAANLATHSRLLALGGITEENTHQCLAAGAQGIAAIRLFL